MAVPDRQAPTLAKAWETLHKKFGKSGVAPTTYIQDNEISRHMRDCFDKEGVEYHLVPPHNHRANAAERAIQTFKNHFIVGLSGLDPKLPIRQ